MRLLSLLHYSRANSFVTRHALKQRRNRISSTHKSVRLISSNTSSTPSPILHKSYTSYELDFVQPVSLMYGYKSNNSPREELAVFRLEMAGVCDSVHVKAAWEIAKNAEDKHWTKILQRMTAPNIEKSSRSCEWVWILVDKLDDTQWKLVIEKLINEKGVVDFTIIDSGWGIPYTDVDRWDVIIKRMVDENVSKRIFRCGLAWFYADFYVEKDWLRVCNRMEESLVGIPFINCKHAWTMACTVPDEMWRLAVTRLKETPEPLLQHRIVWDLVCILKGSVWQRSYSRMTVEGLDTRLFNCEPAWRVAGRVSEERWKISYTRMLDEAMYHGFSRKSLWAKACSLNDEKWANLISRMATECLGAGAYKSDKTWSVAMVLNDENWEKTLTRIVNSGDVPSTTQICDPAWECASKFSEKEWKLVLSRMTSIANSVSGDDKAGLRCKIFGRKSAWALAARVSDEEWESILLRLTDSNLTSGAIAGCDSAWFLVGKLDDSQWKLVTKRLNQTCNGKSSAHACGSAWSIAGKATEEKWETTLGRMLHPSMSPCLIHCASVWNLANQSSNEEWEILCTRISEIGSITWPGAWLLCSNCSNHDFSIIKNILETVGTGRVKRATIAKLGKYHYKVDLNLVLFEITKHFSVIKSKKDRETLIQDVSFWESKIS